MSGNDSAINASGLRSATRRKPAVCFTAEIAQFDVRLVSPVTTGPSGQPEGYHSHLTLKLNVKAVLRYPSTAL